MTGRSARIVVIGLELGDGPLIRDWADAGLLPAINAMMAQGTWGWLETTADRLHISAWPTLYTGATPGDHGVYFTFQPAPGLQGYQRFQPGQYGRPTFWSILDAAGYRCAVLDAPYTHPESGYRGQFINDWGTWAHYLQPGSAPDGLLKRLESACGKYPLGLEANDLGLAPLESSAIAMRLAGSIRAKTEATCWLMKQDAPEIVFAVFGETHVAGHYCWSAELEDEQRRRRPSDMLSVYQELDRGIARIREEAGEDAIVMLLSGDCVGANYAGWHLLPAVLEKLGCSAGPANDGSEDKTAPTPRSFDPVKALRDLLPKDFRKNLARKLPTKLRDRLAQRVDMAGVDWSRTQAYCLPTDLEGYIRVNLRGREPQGTVSPGAEYEALLGKLEDALTELRDPDSGQPVVREVIRVADTFPGTRTDYLPDLIVCWHSSRPITRVASDRIGLVEAASPDSRGGTHRGPGFVIGQGPGIPAGQQVSGGNILDFVPTLLTRLGVAVPAYMPGRVWAEFSNQERSARSQAR